MGNTTGSTNPRLSTNSGVEMIKPGDKRTGYLFNFKAVTVASESGAPESGLYLYFIDKYGKTFSCVYRFHPYFLVDFSEDIGSSGIESAVTMLKTRFPQAMSVELEEKDDLDMMDHLNGRKHPLVRITFSSMDPYSSVKRELMAIAKDNAKTTQFSRSDPIDYVRSLAEHDVPIHVRACIDHGIRVGKWYRVSVQGGSTTTEADSAVSSFAGNATIEILAELLMKPDLRVFAWDIETSKAPLKFPDSAIDPIIMISVMADGRGYLFVNREEVVSDIEDFDYAPKPDMEGHFVISNCEDEKKMLQAFYNLIKKLTPQILVTFNGDNFDFPYVEKRSEILGLDMGREIGIYKMGAGSDNEYYAGRWMLHMDCYAWVQRDSYLPQGSQGLKAVTKYKLKYDPVELDPENIAPFARTNPQGLASYSVSDALSTFYLFKKYIQDFIFALCTVIPTHGDEVLRKGSGTLCEMLLMAEAFRANVVFPNKHSEELLQFHNGRLIETSTYEGGRVECLRTGIFRSDFPEKFNLDLAAIRDLQADVGEIVKFYCEKEALIDVKDVVNFDEIVSEIRGELEKLAENPKIEEEPLIYHLDVAAMYPNIILSNRLQPSAIVSPDACAACTFNRDAESNRCQRKMNWKWRGDLYKATKADVAQITRELEAPAHQYLTVDRDTGESKKVPWKELNEKEKHEILIRNVRSYSVRAYKRVKSPVMEDRTDTVCQRENSFYIDTVRAFRDRRYEFKDLTKFWKNKLEAAEGDIPAQNAAQDMILLFDSLQLAHKCILNSFYGYVMRKGARWHSMKMAGIVTFTGSNLIREAREFVDRMGIPLELDTDGIWCMLPKSFPDRFKLQLANGTSSTLTFACSLLNVRVHRKYSNDQYQMVDRATGEWKTMVENSIFFEIDGPYRAMVIPASTEEDRMLKKRYAVYNQDGSIAELKGFEIKRRGELKLVQVFQENVFPAFLQGKNREEVYAAVGKVANTWIDVLDTKGAYLTDAELVDLISERKNMSKSVAESGNLKSASITTVKRIASFLGESILKEKGICCHLVIANRPIDASATERAIPLQIFSAEENVKRSFLRKWLNDPFITDFDIRHVIDWEYYKTRLGSTVQKLVIIPALEQRITNPCPSIEIVDWMKRRLAIQNDKFQQTSLAGFVTRTAIPHAAPIAHRAPVTHLVDIEEMGSNVNIADIRTAVRLAGIEDVLANVSEEEVGPSSATAAVEWASWQKNKWKALRAQRAAAAKEASRHSRLGALQGQQSSLTRDILKASAAGLASMGGIKNRRMGVLPWHVLSVTCDSPDTLVLWVTLGEGTSIQRVSLPFYRTITVLLPANASSLLSQLPLDCFSREVSVTLPPEIEGGSLFEVSAPDSVWRSLAPVLRQSGGTAFGLQNAPAFDWASRLGAMVQVRDSGKVTEDFYASLALEGESQFSFLKESKEQYLSGAQVEPIFVHYSETNSPSLRAFVVVFSPRLESVFVGFVGVPPPQRFSNAAVLKLVQDELAALEEGQTVQITVVESSFHDSVTGLARSANRFAEESLKRIGYHAVGVVSTESEFPLPSIASIPVARSPFSQLDSAFPALDWARWALKRWTSRTDRLMDWWEDRLWLARVARVPLCSLPPTREAYGFALDVLLSRALREEVKHVQWNQDLEEAESRAVSILAPHRSERMSCEETSNPGIYRSVCLSLNLKSSLCIAALSHANIGTLEASLANDKQFVALLSVVESLFLRGKQAQAKLSKLQTPISSELEHRHRDDAASDRKRFEAESEVRACGQLLSFLFGWISNSTSILFSPELLSKTIHAMNVTLALLQEQLERSGCQIIFANFSKIVFATNKTELAQVSSFWESLRANISEHPVLRALALDETSVTHAMFGMTWLDASNYAFVPVSTTGEIAWRVEAQWKLGECLPPALRAPFYTYSSEFLMKPMRALTKLSASVSHLTNAQKQNELTLYILNSAIPQIRKKLYSFISEVEGKRQNDLVLINAAMEDDEEEEAVNSDESDFEDPPDVRRKRRINELRAKWEFPQLPGVVFPEATKGLSPAVEFAKYIWEILALERIDVRAVEEIAAMRNDLLKFFRVSPFSKAAEFANPIKNKCKVVHVCCTRCGETSAAVDVVSGPFQGPGLWECTLCGGVFDRDMMESRLVDIVNTVVQGWQTQTLHCEKCKTAKTRLLSKYCDCSGKYATRIEKPGAIELVTTIQSVALAHDLLWLQDSCAFFLKRI